MREQKKECSPAVKRWRRPLMFALAWFGVAGACYCWGRYGSLPRAVAEPTTGRAVVQEAVSERPPADSSRRPVAFIYDNIPITREELGEYLIQRFGKERLKNLINKRIIDHVAHQRGLDVTATEINASLQADAASLGVTPKEFTDQILKRYGKTLYEWKEDVIRPRLIMEKMCRARVTVTREDLAEAFDAKYGDKVDCKIIMWPKAEKKIVLDQIWPRIRNSEQEFDHFARLQVSPSLAAVGGHIKPIGHHTTGEERLEKVVFSLRPGEVSEVLDHPEGLVVVKCLGHVDPDKTVSFDQRRGELEKEVFDKKVAMEIGKVFQELQVQAHPQNLLEPTVNVDESTQRLLSATGGMNAGPRAVQVPPSTAAPAPSIPAPPAAAPPAPSALTPAGTK